MVDTVAPAVLGLGKQSVELPVLKGTLGPDVVDVRKLYGEADVFTYDPSFTSTASCDSKITFIDGDKGILLHRGYPIDQLAEQSSFLEVCYLLLYGELPTAPQYAEFERNITYHTMLHAQFDRFFEGFRRDAHPMGVLTGTVGALSAFYPDSIDVSDPTQREISAHRLIAKMPTIAARAFKYWSGQPFISPRNNLTYAENFVRMCFAVPAEDYVSNPVLNQAMDRIFILHADHEQNASTSTVRMAGSSGANPFACIAADEMIVPELIQDACNGPAIAERLSALLDDAGLRARQMAAQAAALERLGRGVGPAAELAAEAVIRIASTGRGSAALIDRDV